MQFRMAIEYDGTGFAGWQIQPDERTVQGEIEAALGRLLGCSTRAVAAGRTDAGVHARGQVVCFHTDRPLPPDVVRRALNAMLEKDLAVRLVDVVADDFDPRRSARRRTYEYRIWNDRVRSPFWTCHAWHVMRPLDIDAMRRAAADLLGERDFSSFRAAGCDAAHPIRRVIASDWGRDEHGLLVYRVAATAFLRHMVRNIVGTLVEVGRGKRSADGMPALLAERNRDLAGPTAPAHGLCLTAVEY
jgi:tRNA pseudouridine38-40 synthase